MRALSYLCGMTAREAFGSTRGGRVWGRRHLVIMEVIPLGRRPDGSIVVHTDEEECGEGAPHKFDQ